MTYNEQYRTHRIHDGPCAGCGKNMRERQVAFTYEGALYHRRCHPPWKDEVQAEAKKAEAPPPKPRPVLDLGIAGVNLRKAREAYDRAKSDYRISENAVLKRNGVDPETHNVGGSWDCPTSPLKICVYKDDDRYNDFCIYCGDPEERK